MSSAHSANTSFGRRNLLLTVIFLLVIFSLGKFFDPYNQGQLAVVLMLFIGVLSITVLTGASGQLSLGQGALMAVGGYSCALAMLRFGFNIWISISLAVVVSSVAGLILGVAAARLSGPYLAGTTLVVALAIPSLANRFEPTLGGDVGLNVDFGTPPSFLTAVLGEIGYEQWQLFATLPFAALALFFTSNLMSSRTGRSWRALRDHEIAAALSGVNVQRSKIFVFIIAAGLAGLAGALYGLRGIVGPSVYAISLSFTLLTAAVLGGIRSIGGALIGALLVVFLPDWVGAVTDSLQLSEKISNYLPALLAAALLILTIVLNPGGVAGSVHHSKSAKSAKSH